MGKQATITNDTDDFRYELRLDGDLAAYAAYVIKDGIIDFNHTVTLEEHRGRGVATQLLRAALQDVRARGEYQVRVSCCFCADFVDKNPEFQDLLAD